MAAKIAERLRRPPPRARSRTSDTERELIGDGRAYRRMRPGPRQ